MVRVEGKKGLFVVKRVHGRHKEADVVQRVWNRDVLELTVPIQLIRTISPPASAAIQQFLGAKPDGPSRSSASAPESSLTPMEIDDSLAQA
jgi:hypothetical protein